MSLNARLSSHSSMILNLAIAISEGAVGSNHPGEMHSPSYSCCPYGSVAPSGILNGLWLDCGYLHKWHLSVVVAAAEVRQLCIGAVSEPQP